MTIQDGPADAFAKLAILNPTPPTAGGASAERTFVLLKPTAVKRGLVAEISKRFERRGLSLVAMKMLKPGSELSSQHYMSRKGSDEFKSLVSDLAPGPAVAMLWQGAGSVQGVRQLIGDDNPAAALPGTVRGDLALEAAAELVESAPSAADAEKLAKLWFTPAELAEARAAPLAATPPAVVAPAPPAAPKAGGAGRRRPRWGRRRRRRPRPRRARWARASTSRPPSTTPTARRTWGMHTRACAPT
jgi:nucleoside-diphosphate kinase